MRLVEQLADRRGIGLPAQGVRQAHLQIESLSGITQIRGRFEARRAENIAFRGDPFGGYRLQALVLPRQFVERSRPVCEVHEARGNEVALHISQDRT